MQIVLARLDLGQEIARPGRADLGERHTFREIAIPVAVMWLNDGSQIDLDKANAFARIEGYAVFCYDDEPDPLNRARREIASRAA